MRQVGKANLGAIVLAGLFSIACPPSAPAAECLGHSDEPLVSLLQPPPCETCEETKAELGELSALEQARTPAQTEHAARDGARSPRRRVRMPERVDSSLSMKYGKHRLTIKIVSGRRSYRRSISLEEGRFPRVATE